jgi:bacterioferritin-associated ferredoxin
VLLYVNVPHVQDASALGIRNTSTQCAHRPRFAKLSALVPGGVPCNDDAMHEPPLRRGLGAECSTCARRIRAGNSEYVNIMRASATFRKAFSPRPGGVPCNDDAVHEPPSRRGLGAGCSTCARRIRAVDSEYVNRICASATFRKLLAPVPGGVPCNDDAVHEPPSRRGLGAVRSKLRLVYSPSYHNPFSHSHATATASISTRPPSGSAATCTAERAGGFSGKNSA